MAERVARALNLLGADRDLFDSPDTDALLDLIDDYFDDLMDSEGKFISMYIIFLHQTTLNTIKIHHKLL